MQISTSDSIAGLKTERTASDSSAIGLSPMLALLAGAFAAWACADSLTDLWSQGWNDGESSQILIAPVAFIWLAWVRRKKLRDCSFVGRWLGVGIIVAAWALWGGGYRYQVQTFWHLGAILLVVGAIIAFLGEDVFWKFLPAWGALLFMVPLSGRVRQHVSIPMEQWTAVMTQSVAEVLGIPCGRSGNQLTVNGKDVCIVEACNGLRMILTLLLGCYVFAFVNPLKNWVRWVVLLASPVVAIVCNVIRLVPTLWMFGHASDRVAENFHDFAGWGMLLVAFGLLTGFTKLLSWLGVSVSTDDAAVGRPVALN